MMIEEDQRRVHGSSIMPQARKTQCDSGETVQILPPLSH